jgi:MFS family permease
MFVAPVSARVVERLGPARVVSFGLTAVATGLALASTMGVDTPYVWLAAVLVIMAAGMALTMAPSTASIMSSLPLGKAGVGSAWNDTTRELGGALGVAVLGSLAASQYSSSLAGSLGSLPHGAATAAEASVGAAVQLSNGLPAEIGNGLASAARVAFVDAMGVALLVAAGVALVAAFLVRRYLPAHVEVDRRPPQVVVDGATEVAEGTVA